jgi:serine O-acetyltransferase
MSRDADRSKRTKRPTANERREDVAQRLAAGARQGGVPHEPPPTAEQVDRLLGALRRCVFPGHFEAAEDDVGAELTRRLGEVESLLGAQILASINIAEPYARDAGERADSIARGFIDALPGVADALRLDARAAFDADPAARQVEEIILCYPGFEAVFAYRVANALLRMGVPVLPRMLTERAHARTGVDIHPGAEIGASFFIDHGTGVVIGETTVIGDGVTLYQGVTLGAKSFPKDEHGRVIRGIKRHPTVGDHVTIYAGAIILGGDTTIGARCIVSANVYLTKSVPPGHIVRQRHGEISVIPNPGANPEVDD